MKLDVFIAGDPAPQGSKRYVGNGIMIEASKKNKPWRADVRSALLQENGLPKWHFDGAVNVTMAFVMPRPKGAPKRSTPLHTKKPDLDKLMRAVMDAISSAGVWRDDCQVIVCTLGKRVAEIGETAGLWLSIHSADATSTGRWWGKTQPEVLASET